RYLDFYKNNARGRRLMRHWLARAGRYQRLISDVLAKHKLPRALAFVAMVESSFNPTLTSRVGAAGIWQFMPRSGRWYGLARDYWIDERRNPERSTDSAARLLKRLRGMFGTWELALAAYNAGAGAVIVAMKRYNTNDYYQLCRYEAGLPWATTLYVPKILATAIVANNRAAFGFADVKGDAPLAHDLVALPRSLSVRQIARAAGVDRDVVETYNPELRRGRTPPGKSWIRLPKGKKKGFYEALAKLGSARYRPYTVRLGESDTSLAARFGISRTRLRAINGVQHARELRPGTTILVPARVKPQRKHKRRRGKRKRSVSARDDDDSATVLVALPPGVPRRVSGRRHVFYRTVVGDSIDEIAKHLDVSAADLAAWNGLDPRAKLVSEMVLQAFIKPSFDTSKVVLLPDDRVELVVAGSAEHMRAHLERDGRRRVVYTARRGDTLVRLSRRFGLSIGSIMRINRFSRSTKLEKGQKLVIYMHKDPRVRRRKAREIARARYKRVVRMRRAKLRARRRKLRDKRRRQRQARLRRKTQRAKN
ncbi:MAG: transglycosylase SLT domain-containing protein, partial [Myxococcales bacterium]|nr:transglycosylase SLT domain-containing protein [Myxococcales bacterium]